MSIPAYVLNGGTVRPELHSSCRFRPMAKLRRTPRPLFNEIRWGQYSNTSVWVHLQQVVVARCRLHSRPKPSPRTWNPLDHGSGRAADLPRLFLPDIPIQPESRSVFLQTRIVQISDGAEPRQVH